MVAKLSIVKKRFEFITKRKYIYVFLFIVTHACCRWGILSIKCALLF